MEHRENISLRALMTMQRRMNSEIRSSIEVLRGSVENLSNSLNVVQEEVREIRRSQDTLRNSLAHLQSSWDNSIFSPIGGPASAPRNTTFRYSRDVMLSPLNFAREEQRDNSHAPNVSPRVADLGEEEVVVNPPENRDEIERPAPMSDDGNDKRPSDSAEFRDKAAAVPEHSDNDEDEDDNAPKRRKILAPPSRYIFMPAQAIAGGSKEVLFVEAPKDDDRNVPRNVQGDGNVPRNVQGDINVPRNVQGDGNVQSDGNVQREGPPKRKHGGDSNVPSKRFRDIRDYFLKGAQPTTGPEQRPVDRSTEREKVQKLIDQFNKAWRSNLTPKDTPAPKETMAGRDPTQALPQPVQDDDEEEEDLYAELPNVSQQQQAVAQPLPQNDEEEDDDLRDVPAQADNNQSVRVLSPVIAAMSSVSNAISSDPADSGSVPAVSGPAPASIGFVRAVSGPAPASIPAPISTGHIQGQSVNTNKRQRLLNRNCVLPPVSSIPIVSSTKAPLRRSERRRKEPERFAPETTSLQKMIKRRQERSERERRKRCRR